MAEDDDDDDGEVAAVFSVAGDGGAPPPPPPPVGSVRPFDFVVTPPLLAAGESLSSLIKSSTLLWLLQFSCSLLLVLALSGTSTGCCFSEFDSILLFVIALC